MTLIPKRPAEEIARIVGMTISKHSYKIPLNLEKKNKISMIEDFFVENGFSEVINFHLQKKKKKINFIDNPLDSNRTFKSFLRIL